MSRGAALLLFIALTLTGCAAAIEGIEACREDTLVDRWKISWGEEYWTFAPDGSLRCEGTCEYGPGVGRPQSWDDDPSANMWARRFGYLKLVFTEKTFEGSIGAYRCQIHDQGRALRLKPFRGPDLDFTRAGP